MALLTSKCFAVWWLWRLSLLRGTVLCSVDDLSGRTFVSFFAGGNPAPPWEKKGFGLFLEFCPKLFPVSCFAACDCLQSLTQVISK